MYDTQSFYMYCLSVVIWALLRVILHQLRCVQIKTLFSWFLSTLDIKRQKKKKMWICVEDQRPYSFGAYDKHIILGDIAIWCSVLNFTCILVYLYYVFNVILLVIVYHKIWKKSPRSENMKEIEWSLFCIRMSWSKN